MTDIAAGATPWSARLNSRSAAETMKIGGVMASCLRRGDVVGLVGELGAGKTQLVKGIATGLGVVDDRTVTSPTFVLMNEYTGADDQGPVSIYHFDAYRLRDAQEFVSLGFEEMGDSEAIILVEWADRVRSALSVHPETPKPHRLEAGATGEASATGVSGRVLRSDSVLWIEILPVGEQERTLLCGTSSPTLGKRFKAADWSAWDADLE